MYWQSLDDNEALFFHYQALATPTLLARTAYSLQGDWREILDKIWTIIKEKSAVFSPIVCHKNHQMRFVKRLVAVAVAFLSSILYKIRTYKGKIFSQTKNSQKRSRPSKCPKQKITEHAKDREIIKIQKILRKHFGHPDSRGRPAFASK